MHYQDILLDDYIDEYKETHRWLYNRLTGMIFTITFLNKTIEWGHKKVCFDQPWAVVSGLFRREFELAILMLFRDVFDSGNDAITLIKFHNAIMQNILPHRQSEVVARIKETTWKADTLEAVRQRLNAALHIIRNRRIAHSLKPQITSEAVIHLADITKLVDSACDLFQALSFEPGDFYKASEGNGCNFQEEKESCERQIEVFYRYLSLSSTHVDKISVQYSEYANEDDIVVVSESFAQINMDKAARHPLPGITFR